MSDDYKPDTLGVRAGGLRSDFREHSEALVLTSSFVFRSAGEAARRFADEEPGNIYSRFTNPTVTMFQQRLAALEGAEACVATSTGMAAVATTAMGLLSAGDHVVAARGVFGTVVPLLDQILKRFGVETTWVDATDLDAWRAALRPSTKLLFAETPSNPVCEIVDIAGLAAIARKAGAILAIDNCMCSPALQRPIGPGRGPRGAFGHQVHRRAGARARRRHRRPARPRGRPALQLRAHGRTGHLALQRLDLPEGPGDDAASRRGAVGARARSWRAGSSRTRRSSA